MTSVTSSIIYACVLQLRDNVDRRISRLKDNKSGLGFEIKIFGYKWLVIGGIGWHYRKHGTRNSRAGHGKFVLDRINLPVRIVRRPPTA